MRLSCNLTTCILLHFGIEKYTCAKMYTFHFQALIKKIAATHCVPILKLFVIERRFLGVQSNVPLRSAGLDASLRILHSNL